MTEQFKASLERLHGPNSDTSLPFRLACYLAYHTREYEPVDRVQDIPVEESGQTSRLKPGSLLKHGLLSALRPGRALGAGSQRFDAKFQPTPAGQAHLGT